ncbi:MAG TPA: hypothetical protein VE781_14355 [Kineosporiaceae bacterium]|nr:hypothetical protein [Kineosporiaceae bacterium]
MSARAAWFRSALLVLLASAVLAGVAGQPSMSAVLVGTVLAVAVTAVVATLLPSVWTVDAGSRLRAWGHAQHRIVRAEAPDRPGRPRPRAPGASQVASGI